MTVVDLALGFVVGLVATTLAFELGIKKFLPKSQESSWTKDWNLSSVGPKPSVVAERISGVDLPEGARVIVRSMDKSLDRVPDGVDVQEDPSVTGNYVVGRSRALVFNSVIHPQAPVVHTVDEQIVDKLNRQFDRMWYGDRRSADAETTVVDDEVSAHGVVVDVEEVDGGGWLAKLSSQGRTLPVAVADAQGLQGQAVRVSGKVVFRDGERVLQADRVERTGGPGR